MRYIVFTVLLFLGIRCSTHSGVTETELTPLIQFAESQDFINQNKEKEYIFVLKLKAPLPKDIVLKELFYQNKSGEVMQKNDTKYYANLGFKKHTDLNFDNDPKKEYGNKAPVIKKCPVKIKENEAVLAYQKNDKTVYLILKNVKKTPSLIHPGAISK